MDLIPAQRNWNCCARTIPLPHLTFDALKRLADSGIGTLYSSEKCSFICFLTVDDQTDLATMHAILGGEDVEWKGNVDDQLLLRALTGYMESHPSQEYFCFTAFTSDSPSSHENLSCKC